jgi:NDP-sugar pyrophosphorylase family protein
MRAVILAGGKGVRLRPYTTLIPKPLVPMGNEMPVMEIIIRQLARYGFDHITVCLNHMANLIAAFFGDGSKWGVKMDYVEEDKPLSTIAPLTLISDLPEDFLTINGDVLCDLNYSEFLDHHTRKRSSLTVATYKRTAKIDFGVIEFGDDRVIAGFKEKPDLFLDVCMGVNCIHRSVIEGLKKGEPYGFDNLVLDGIRMKRKYMVYPFGGFWLDLGRPEDYDYCNEHYAEIKTKLGF